uniref:Cyclic nucleotide-binding domain-containing protein n=1 Tax=Neobodo designis TaxID=312471 RepID=A0A7S1LJZ2_NEODS
MSTMTAFATSFLTSDGVLEQEASQMRQMVFAMLEHYDIPWEVQKEVIAAVPALLEAEHEHHFKDLTAKLPDFVGKKVEGYMRCRMLLTVPLFATFEDRREALLALGKLLQQQFRPPGDVIIHQGTFGTDMFFLRRGVVHVVLCDDAELWDDDESDSNSIDPEAIARRGRTVAALQTGAFFGEIELLKDTPRRASVIAVTMCELLCLSRTDFLVFVTQYPDVALRLRESLLASEAFADREDDRQELARSTGRAVVEDADAVEVSGPLASLPEQE